jgi:drug/metabolite transporter (DMT)-like permease
LGGLVYLVAPGIAAPPLTGAVLMAGAGVAWGLYSLRGRGASDPLRETAGNFARALPFAVAVSIVAAAHTDVSLKGSLLAVASGAVASGLGYAVWYAALRGLTATQAATVQLLVPALAALGGVLILGERITTRLTIAAVLILGGVALALTRTERRRQRQRPAEPRREGAPGPRP